MDSSSSPSSFSLLSPPSSTSLLSSFIKNCHNAPIGDQNFAFGFHFRILYGALKCQWDAPDSPGFSMMYRGFLWRNDRGTCINFRSSYSATSGFKSHEIRASGRDMMQYDGSWNPPTCPSLLPPSPLSTCSNIRLYYFRFPLEDDRCEGCKWAASRASLQSAPSLGVPLPTSSPPGSISGVASVHFHTAESQLMALLQVALPLPPSLPPPPPPPPLPPQRLCKKNFQVKSAQFEAPLGVLHFPVLLPISSSVLLKPPATSPLPPSPPSSTPSSSSFRSIAIKCNKTRKKKKKKKKKGKESSIKATWSFPSPPPPPPSPATTHRPGAFR